MPAHIAAIERELTRTGLLGIVTIQDFSVCGRFARLGMARRACCYPAVPLLNAMARVPRGRYAGTNIPPDDLVDPLLDDLGPLPYFSSTTRPDTMGIPTTRWVMGGPWGPEDPSTAVSYPVSGMGIMATAEVCYDRRAAENSPTTGLPFPDRRRSNNRFTI